MGPSRRESVIYVIQEAPEKGGKKRCGGFWLIIRTATGLFVSFRSSGSSGDRGSESVLPDIQVFLGRTDSPTMPSKSDPPRQRLAERIPSSPLSLLKGSLGIGRVFESMRQEGIGIGVG
jgi:hypothetical protein